MRVSKVVICENVGHSKLAESEALRYSFCEGNNGRETTDSLFAMREGRRTMRLRQVLYDL